MNEKLKPLLQDRKLLSKTAKKFTQQETFELLKQLQNNTTDDKQKLWLQKTYEHALAMSQLLRQRHLFFSYTDTVQMIEMYLEQNQ